MVIDIIVGIVLLLSAIIAFIRGFIREVLTIAGVVGGLAAAYFLGPFLSPSFRNWLSVNPDPEQVEKLLGVIPMNYVADGLAYFCIFIVIVIAISIASHFMAEGIKSLGLGAVDRTLGVIFGLVRGVILLGLFYLPFYLFLDQETKAEYFSGSQTHFYLEETAGYIAGFLPESASENVKEQIDKAEEIKGAKDRLKDLNLLQDPEKVSPEPENTDGQDGYQEPFRDELNDLFRQNQTDESTFNE